VGVHPAVLAHRVPPLLPQRGRVGLLLARHSKDGSFGGSDSPRVREGGRRRLGCRKARRSRRDGCGGGGAAEFKAGERGGRGKEPKRVRVREV
jgi:hypothetical protein